jgi:penicillin-binding protein 1A
MKWFNRILKIALTLGMFVAAAGIIVAVLAYLFMAPDLPSTENLRDVQLQVPLRIYTRDQQLIAEFGEKRRIPVTYAEVPEKVVQAFLAAEDDRFFEHPGVDYQGILRAGIQLALTGERRQGGSTITMQLARNFYLSPEKTFTRKINEILLALKIERALTKEEILELYLNKIYLGNRAYGVGAAAEVYYGKKLNELTLPQIAMIAGLPKAPSRYNPIVDPERARERRNYVLGRMEDLDYITEEEANAARESPVTATLHSASLEVEAPYLAEMVRAEMVERYGTDAYTEGYRVITTIDSRLQTAADEAVRTALHEYDQRHGYRGPEQHLDLSTQRDPQAWSALLKEIKTVGNLRPALVIKVEEKTAEVYLEDGSTQRLEWEALQWARHDIDENSLGPWPKQASDILKPGDIIRLRTELTDKGPVTLLAQIPTVEGALVSLRPDDGSLVALVGGYDYYHSKFNRAVQAKRQPGSGFKPFLYSAALEDGFTAASLINDAPVVIDDPTLEAAWRPENYSGKFFGPTRLREALVNSRNLVSIRLLRAMGIDYALHYVERFGFKASELPRNLSLALGSGNVTLMQMAGGYAVLANGGFRVEPYFIEHIEDGAGVTIYKASPLQVCHNCDQPLAPEYQTPSPEEGQGATLHAARQYEVQSMGDTPEAEQQSGEGAPRIAPRVITPQNDYLMNSMMRDVVQRGTATRARVLGRQDLAGKTGTTNDQRDAWFNGFQRNLVAIAWVGFDSSDPLGRGEVGGRAALPAWIDFMREALQGVPEASLEMPPDMVTVRIDPETGKPAPNGQSNAIFEVFTAATAPSEDDTNTTGFNLEDGAASGDKSDKVKELF